MPFDSGRVDEVLQALQEAHEREELEALLDAQRITNLYLAEMSGFKIKEEDIECQ